MSERCQLAISKNCRTEFRRLHGVESSHIESVPIKETLQGRTLGKEFVEVFELKNHPSASRLYGWPYETDNPKKPKHITVLHMGPITSPLLAVHAAIVEEFRNLGAEQA
jgi:hypothetical protein